MRAVSGRFPDYGWAWPSADLDRLLKAALLPEDRALELARDWLVRNDIETAGFREHRLLATISHRFGRRLADHPAYPRLVGLQKMLWSRSRLAVREAEPALRAFGEAAVPTMLIKGAARVALDARLQKGRVSHDIDVLVRPAHMSECFAILRALGWEPATGGSADALAGRLQWLPSLNFQKGEFGDVDLHQQAYHPVHASSADEEGLWRRAIGTAFGGVSVFVPAASDRIAMAIAHGGLDAHTHSDWLVDCDAALREDGMSWTDLMETVEHRRIAVPTMVALSYLAEEIGSPVPAGVLDDLRTLADRSGFLARVSGLLQAKPRGSYGLAVWLARGIAKQQRMRSRSSGRGVVPPMPVWRGSRLARIPKPAVAAMKATLQPAPLPTSNGPFALSLGLDCELPPVRRRVDFELRSGNRLVALLRYRNHTGRGGTCRLTFSGPISAGMAADLIIEARPTRFLRNRADPLDLARHGAVPFRVAIATWSE
ncbi:nucleotidyltransferase family protein [Aquibium microcysteis]|uniref:nucleotidyltransferase family protein n=1 Tax=Aquibium microcysteis TaxID=675281 RepID=UPI00165D0AD4|nr:nucleotidyltransferase family protein [Aquibium microcysteis]